MSQQQDRLYHLIQFGIMINWVWTLDSGGNQLVLMYQIQSNPDVSNCQQGNYGTFAKAWALIRLLVHVRAKQMVGVEWRQDNRRKSPDIIQSWLSRQQKVPASCFLFHPAAPFTSPTTSLFHVFQTMHTFMLRSSKHSLLPYLNNSKGINEHFNLITLDI